jgi:hypothetical protein
MNELLMRVALLSLSFEKEISFYAEESSAYKIKCIWRLLVCAWKGRVAGGIPRSIHPLPAGGAAAGDAERRRPSARRAVVARF